jgi:hypothetical protein
MQCKFEYVTTSSEEARIILNDYPESLKTTTNCLYKGINYLENPQGFYLVNPSFAIRKSRTLKETGNIHNLIIDNLPSWENYPKREKSIIFSTLYRTAKIYGICYHVFPKIGSQVAICPNDDFWNSFRPALIRMGLVGNRSNLITLNNALYEIGLTFGLKKVDFIDWTIFSKFAEDFDSIVPNSLKISDFSNNLIRKVYEHNHGLISFLNHVLSPSINGFTIDIFNHRFKHIHNSEMWTEGQCLLVKEDQMVSFYK